MAMIGDERRVSPRSARRGLSFMAALLIAATTWVVGVGSAGAQDGVANPGGVTCSTNVSLGIDQVRYQNGQVGDLVVHLREITPDGSRWLAAVNLSPLSSSRRSFDAESTLGFFVRYRMNGSTFDIPCVPVPDRGISCTVGPNGVTVSENGASGINAFLREVTPDGSVWRASFIDLVGSDFAELDTNESLGFFVRARDAGVFDFACEPA